MPLPITGVSERNLINMFRARGFKLERPHPGAGTPLYNFEGRWIAAHIGWRGAEGLKRHFRGSDLAFVRDGADGKWLAVVGASELLDLMHDARKFRELRDQQESQAGSNDILNESEQSPNGAEPESNQ